MNGEKPRLTPRQKRIAKAALKGIPPAAIAERFKVQPHAIRMVLSRLRAKGEQIEDFRSSQHRAPATNLRLPRSKLTILRREAKRRGLSTRELAERIIAAAIKRGAVSDLLDGEG